MRFGRTLTAQFTTSAVLLVSVGALALTGCQRVQPAPLEPPPEQTITTIEGWNNRQIASYLEAQQVATSQDFFAIAGQMSTTQVATDAAISSALRERFSYLVDAPADATLEGYLFPDTYRIFAPTTVGDIVLKMLTNFDRKFTPEMRAKAAAQRHSIHEVVTLASMIEKEVHQPRDRRIVAGLMLERLRIGMPLQLDATVNYVSNSNEPRASAASLAIDSPYNTYKYAGLPPGPIGNPGLDALQAALEPEDSPYLYYLTTADGTVIYSRTLNEHNAAVAKYLR